MKEIKIFLLFPLLLLTVCCGCNKSVTSPAPASETAPQTSSLPTFAGDSALSQVAGLLAFGPRVPGTSAQTQAAAWLEAELARHGAQVMVMKSEAKAYDGTVLPIINVVGSYRPEAKYRVLLMSHWDSRPVADHDPDPTKRHQPVLGANDGASGVGVLLELARLASLQLPKVGIDLFLTDAEDYGAPEEWTGDHSERWWALGTQAWCRKTHTPGYTAQYGILLDMVGAPDATFYREYYSDRYARGFVDQVWNCARELGYASLFRNEQGGGITDDHVFVNQKLGIPTLDIIDTRMEQEGTFYPYWHTTDDTLDKLSAETLQRVGNVLVKLLW